VEGVDARDGAKREEGRGGARSRRRDVTDRRDPRTTKMGRHEIVGRYGFYHMIVVGNLGLKEDEEEVRHAWDGGEGNHGGVGTHGGVDLGGVGNHVGDVGDVGNSLKPLLRSRAKPGRCQDATYSCKRQPYLVF